MLERTKLQITKVDNGYVLKTELSTPHGIAAEKVYSFETFDSMARLIVELFQEPSIFTPKYDNTAAKDLINRYGGCSIKEQSPEEMRDELGELRRFKERALHGKKELEDRLNKTTDSLNKALTTNDSVCEENQALHLKLAGMCLVKGKKPARKR